LSQSRKSSPKSIAPNQGEKERIMNEIKMEIKDGKLCIVIELDVKKQKPSSTGKTLVVATTGGFQAVGEVKVNLTVTRSKELA